MKLKSVTIQLFKNFVDPQTFAVEDDVTCLVGKNESGKTTILKAMHRLLPANGDDAKFDLTLEYPRWRLSRDKRGPSDPLLVRPVTGVFEADEGDCVQISDVLGLNVPPMSRFAVSRDYQNSLHVRVDAAASNLIHHVASTAELDAADRADIEAALSVDEATDKARTLAKSLKETGHSSRAKSLTGFASRLQEQEQIVSGIELSEDQIQVLLPLLPQFFYFSNYSLLPGECNLTALAGKDPSQYSESDRTVRALLAHAGEKPSDFLDTSYDSRKAELQAASSDLSNHVFQYWRQNTDLAVVFDTDLVVKSLPNGQRQEDRLLKIEIRDARHGNVETNFSTRSSGFQWFFSFFAAFSEHQASSQPLIVLLDEPATSLHGDAQADFVRFVYEELGGSKQTLYTTHSQHMVDPGRYEKIRAVQDRATREAPELGVSITELSLMADRETVLPVEAALGYSISRHLFLGSGHHLAVEGSSDFIFLQQMSEYLESQGRTGLRPEFSIIPVGGADNLPAFVAILGRRLQVSALIDGRSTSTRAARVRAAAESNGVNPDHVIAVAEVDDSLPNNSDIEDLFAIGDYLRLHNWAFDGNLDLGSLPATTEPILKRIESSAGAFDHALPAHALTRHRGAFFDAIEVASADRFEELFVRLNSTLGPENV